MTKTPTNAKAFGQKLQQHRGSMGVRTAAREIGISPATLSRIENGGIPDMATLQKVCDWLGVDAASYLGTTSIPKTSLEPGVQVVFKKKQTLTTTTSQALGRLIMKAHQQFSEEIKADGHQ
jgi:transcriptional regulator with XRE-family HTH domain